MRLIFTGLLLLAALTPPAIAGKPLDPAMATMGRLADPRQGVLIASHRGCHNPAPGHGLAASAPENSIAALERCASLGIDIMETDVRMSRDGHLVIMHDATVDRTTDGHGRVSNFTLAELKRLRVRENGGGPAAALTDLRVPTLSEMLSAAKGRIVLNLDIKEAIYPEVIAEVVRQGAQDRVIVKTVAGVASAPLAAMEPYAQVPFMPILSASDAAGSDLAEVARNQDQGRRRPLGYEVPYMDPEQVPALSSEVARQGHRLWANSLFDGFIHRWGGDEDALRAPDTVWGRMIDSGISMIQTDYPADLKDYLKTRKTVRQGGGLP